MKWKERIQIALVAAFALGCVALREARASSYLTISNSTPTPPPNQYSNLVTQPPGTLLVTNGTTFVFSLPTPRPVLTFTRSNVLILPGGTLRLFVDGTSATNYYRIAATNDAYYGGTFEFLQTNGFMAQAGDVFEPFHFSNRTGAFTNITASALAGNLGWLPSYESNRLRLTVVPKTNPPALALVPDTNALLPRISLNGVLGESYVIEATTNLVEWTPVLTNSPFRGWFEAGSELVDPGALLLRAVRVAP